MLDLLNTPGFPLLTQLTLLIVSLILITQLQLYSLLLLMAHMATIAILVQRQRHLRLLIYIILRRIKVHLAQGLRLQTNTGIAQTHHL